MKKGRTNQALPAQLNLAERVLALVNITLTYIYKHAGLRIVNKEDSRYDPMLLLLVNMGTCKTMVRPQA